MNSPQRAVVVAAVMAGVLAAGAVAPSLASASRIIGDGNICVGPKPTGDQEICVLEDP